MTQQIAIDFSKTRFNGSDFSERYDQQRLTKQYIIIRNLMQDGVWRTLREIHELTGFGEASISGQLRNLRKVRFGGYTIDKRRRGDPTKGLFEYQLT